MKRGPDDFPDASATRAQKTFFSLRGRRRRTVSRKRARLPRCNTGEPPFDMYKPRLRPASRLKMPAATRNPVVRSAPFFRVALARRVALATPLVPEISIRGDAAPRTRRLFSFLLSSPLASRLAERARIVRGPTRSNLLSSLPVAAVRGYLKNSAGAFVLSSDPASAPSSARSRTLAGARRLQDLLAVQDAIRPRNSSLSPT